MTQFTSDEQLAKRAKDNDKEAMSELYERYIDRIYRYIAYRIPLKDAENVTAGVFVGMVRSIGNFEYTDASFESWLYRIASECVADFHNPHVREPRDELYKNLRENRTQPEEIPLEKWEMKHIRKALLKLEPEDQELLILRFVERKSHKEVAEMIHMNEAALRIAQYHALKKLAKLE